MVWDEPDNLSSFYMGERIMPLFINTTETIGIIIGSATTTTTGTLFGTLMAIMLILIAISILFGIELEWTAIILLPLTISMGAFYTNFLAPMGAIVIYLSIIFTKNWIFK